MKIVSLLATVAMVVSLSTMSACKSDKMSNMEVDPATKINIEFAMGSSKLSNKAYLTIEEVADKVKGKRFYNIKAFGHASPEGDVKMNMALSEKRVEAVKNALVERGVDPLKITTSFVGEERGWHTDPTRNVRIRVEYF